MKDLLIIAFVVALLVGIHFLLKSRDRKRAKQKLQQQADQAEAYQLQLQSRRQGAVDWARSVLDNKKKFVIVDTETTGLKENDVIIHFAAMSLEGEMLINTYVKPTKKRKASADAEFIHGITPDLLKNAPYFEEVLIRFLEVANGKTVLMYNADFHEQMIYQTYEQDGLVIDGLESLEFVCIRSYFERFHNRSPIGLPGRKNTGEGDCKAAFRVIEEMAKNASEI